MNPSDWHAAPLQSIAAPGLHVATGQKTQEPRGYKTELAADKPPFISCPSQLHPFLNPIALQWSQLEEAGGEKGP